MSKENDVTISERTKVPIGVAVGCGIAFITGAFWITNGMQSMKAEIVDLRHSVATLSRSLEVLAETQTRTHNQFIDRMELQNWILRTRISNKDMVIPDFK